MELSQVRFVIRGIIKNSQAYFFFRVRIMKCRVRIVIVSVVIGSFWSIITNTITTTNHPYPALNNPNPKKEVCSYYAFQFQFTSLQPKTT